MELRRSAEQIAADEGLKWLRRGINPISGGEEHCSNHETMVVVLLDSLKWGFNSAVCNEHVVSRISRQAPF